MTQRATPLMPGLAHPQYGSSSHEWTDAQLEQALDEALRAARAEPGAGFKLECSSAATRERLRERLIEKTTDDLFEVQSSLLTGGWRQIRLRNGSIIRICKMED